MKGIKFMVVAALLAVTTSASAQFANTSKSKEAVGANATSSSLEEEKYVGEFSLYIQDGWGLGLQARKNISKYFAWDIIGISYMTAFDDPSLAGLINFKFLGGRLYTPSFEGCRLYTDLNVGYSLDYVDVGEVETFHSFGLDFGVGFQFGKKVTLGYNLNHRTAFDGITSHWGKISILF